MIASIKLLTSELKPTVTQVPGEVFKTGQSRGKLINDLLELRTFLKTRVIELESSAYVAVEADATRPQLLQDETAVFHFRVGVGCGVWGMGV